MYLLAKEQFLLLKTRSMRLPLPEMFLSCRLPTNSSHFSFSSGDISQRWHFPSQLPLLDRELWCSEIFKSNQGKSIVFFMCSWGLPLLSCFVSSCRRYLLDCTIQSPSPCPSNASGSRGRNCTGPPGGEGGWGRCPTVGGAPHQLWGRQYLSRKPGCFCAFSEVSFHTQNYPSLVTVMPRQGGGHPSHW